MRLGDSAAAQGGAGALRRGARQDRQGGEPRLGQPAGAQILEGRQRQGPMGRMPRGMDDQRGRLQQLVGAQPLRRPPLRAVELEQERQRCGVDRRRRGGPQEIGVPGVRKGEATVRPFPSATNAAWRLCGAAQRAARFVAPRRPAQARPLIAAIISGNAAGTGTAATAAKEKV